MQSFISKQIPLNFIWILISNQTFKYPTRELLRLQKCLIHANTPKLSQAGCILFQQNNFEFCAEYLLFLLIIKIYEVGRSVGVKVQNDHTTSLLLITMNYNHN